MNDSIRTVVGHVLQTLPGEVHERRRVLNAVIECIPPHEIPPDLRTMLGDLDRHLSAQRQLGLDFSGVTDAKHRGSGRLGDTPLAKGHARLGETPLERSTPAPKGGRR